MKDNKALEKIRDILKNKELKIAARVSRIKRIVRFEEWKVKKEES